MRVDGVCTQQGRCNLDLPVFRLGTAIHVFQSTHPMRGATCLFRGICMFDLFQSTHPMRGATCQMHPGVVLDVFQSTHPMRGATLLWRSSQNLCSFQSTHPMRGATAIRPHDPQARCTFQSTHPMRGATAVRLGGLAGRAISIHAPHAGCDYFRRLARGADSDFNPRTPCGVRRFLTSSTPRIPYFNPRTPCGVRRQLLSVSSPHIGFQSTHPMRGATNGSASNTTGYTISIHAPHAGCDHLQGLGASLGTNFNPRTPCGVRPNCSDVCYLCKQQFQSTHPMRGATDVRTFSVLLDKFQSTHPMRGATLSSISSCTTPIYFNPRTPCGVRLLAGSLYQRT